MKGYCCMANYDCAAPAGFAVNGRVHECMPGPVVECFGCGEEVCESRGCSRVMNDPWTGEKDVRLCESCREEREDDE